jgi:hypothetical protein
MRGWEDETRTGFPPEFILSNSKGGNDRREAGERTRMRGWEDEGWEKEKKTGSPIEPGMTRRMAGGKNEDAKLRR